MMLAHFDSAHFDPAVCFFLLFTVSLTLSGGKQQQPILTLSGGKQQQLIMTFVPF